MILYYILGWGSVSRFRAVARGIQIVDGFDRRVHL